MIKGFLVACILIGLFGCAEQPIKSVQKGASKHQIIALLGDPDGSQRSGPYTALRYTNRSINGTTAEHVDYNIILLEGFVVDYGYGYVRQRDPSVNNDLILVPLRADNK